MRWSFGGKQKLQDRFYERLREGEKKKNLPSNKEKKQEETRVSWRLNTGIKMFTAEHHGPFCTINFFFPQELKVFDGCLCFHSDKREGRTNESSGRMERNAKNTSRATIIVTESSLNLRPWIFPCPLSSLFLLVTCSNHLNPASLSDPIFSSLTFFF